jgi:hypothetical protein
LDEPVATLKASRVGLARIKQSRIERGWTIDDPRWLIAASQVLVPTVVWHESGPFAPGISEATWKRFLTGKQPIATPTFKAFCQILDVPWVEIIDRPAVPLPLSTLPQPPDITTFYGRIPELATLSQAIAGDRCRLLTLWGMGGMGKTALAVKLVEQVQSQFQVLLWRSLQTAPTVDKLLLELIHGLNPELKIVADPATETLIDLFLQQLQHRRSLIVLDGWETILGGDRAGQCAPEYALYSKLLQCVSEHPHTSCVVITSREKPEVITLLESRRASTQSLKLVGLGDDAHALLQDKPLRDEPEARTDLIQLYRGNPLALNIVAVVIQDFFNGSIQQALQTGTLVGRELVDHVIAESIQRLSGVERSLLYTLAQRAMPLSLEALKAELTPEISFAEFLEALSSLDRRCLIERSADETCMFFALPPLVGKYITRKLLPRELLP